MPSESVVRCAFANTGFISGPVLAIDVSGATAATPINQNAVSITGAIKLSRNVDVVARSEAPREAEQDTGTEEIPLGMRA